MEPEFADNRQAVRQSAIVVACWFIGISLLPPKRLAVAIRDDYSTGRLDRRQPARDVGVDRPRGLNPDSSTNAVRDCGSQALPGNRVNGRLCLLTQSETGL